jgi:ABC-type branched-subunit amino acid transport system substrate-binding protein
MPASKVEAELNRLALIAAASLMLFGCPPDDGSLAPVFPDLQSPSRPPDITPDPTKEKVRVCILLPSTGSAKDEGAEMRRGMAIAQAEVAVQPWRKRAVEWVEQDTKSTEVGATAAYQRCFAEGFPVIIGPVHPEPVTAIIPVAAAHDALLILPRIGAALPKKWAPQIVAVGPAATSMGTLAGRDAIEGRQITKAAVLHANGIFGTSLKDAFVERYEAGGGTIIGIYALEPGKPDQWFSAAFEAGTLGARALFVVGPPAASEAVAAALRDDPLGGAHAWFIDWGMFPTVPTAAGEHGYRRSHWVNRILPIGEFADTYTTRYQTAPDYAAGDGYDAILVAANAIEGAKEPVPADLIAAARELKGIRGAFGEAALVADGERIVEDAAAYRIFEVRVEDVTANWVFAPPER